MADVVIRWLELDAGPGDAYRLEAELRCAADAAPVDELFRVGGVHYGRAAVPCDVRARYVDPSGAGLASDWSNTVTLPEPAGGLVAGLVLLIVLARRRKARRRRRRRPACVHRTSRTPSGGTENRGD